MKPFDFNIHPNFAPVDIAKGDPKASVMSELTCTASQIIACFKEQFETLCWSDYISGFNCMIFSSYFHDFPEKTHSFTCQMNQLCNNNDLYRVYFLANPALFASFEFILPHWVEAGVKFIKFHSYHQKIADDIIPYCVKIAKLAETLGIGICIDASYGSLDLYRYDNLKLASEILLEIKNVPVVILHAGVFVLTKLP